jgi:mannonate dehydratase
MRYNPVHFAAFDLHAMQRPGAEHDHPADVREQATEWWSSLDDAAREHFIASIIDVFPGVKWGLSLDDIRAMLARYEGIGETELRANLGRFLDAVVPVAEEHGIKLAIHPDDPPFPVLGLPRIVSTAAQLDAILALADSPANGLCFCTGSLGARPDNNLPAMAAKFADRIHALHLRSTTLEADGSFHEASHLEGSTDLTDVLRAFIEARDTGATIPFRPDHGLVMMDDLGKPEGITPGYSAIGRMKGLAEIRGLLHAL